jgi:tRNA-binding protein
VADAAATGEPYDPATLEAKPEIGAEAFFGLDLRVGRIVEVTAFPEARRPAWKLRVDFGPVVGVLQTSAQVTNYPEDELLGRQVVGAVNLGTKRIAGFRSEFLILGGLEPDGTVKLLGVDGDLSPGAPVA